MARRSKSVSGKRVEISCHFGMKKTGWNSHLTYCLWLSFCVSFLLYPSLIATLGDPDRSHYHLQQGIGPSCWAGLEETHQTDHPGSCPGSWETNHAYNRDLGSSYQARQRITGIKMGPSGGGKWEVRAQQGINTQNRKPKPWDIWARTKSDSWKHQDAAQHIGPQIMVSKRDCQEALTVGLPPPPGPELEVKLIYWCLHGT